MYLKLAYVNFSNIYSFLERTGENIFQNTYFYEMYYTTIWDNLLVKNVIKYIISVFDTNEQDFSLCEISMYTCVT